MQICSVTECRNPRWPGGTTCWPHIEADADAAGAAARDQVQRLATWASVDQAFRQARASGPLYEAVAEAGHGMFTPGDVRTAIAMLRQRDRDYLWHLPVRWMASVGENDRADWKVEVVDESGTGLAYRLITADETERRGMFVDAATLPEWRRLGIASRLAQAVFDQFPRIVRWSVKTPNPDGTAFWNGMERRGMVRIRTRLSNATWSFDRL